MLPGTCTTQQQQQQQGAEVQATSVEAAWHAAAPLGPGTPQAATVQYGVERPQLQY
jgi:hypothetical protein